MATGQLTLKCLGGQIAACWDHAEKATIQSIADRYHAPNEETITFLFRSELRAKVDEAGMQGLFERALLKDLQRFGFDVTAVRSQVRGLIACVNPHNHRHEKQSAADLGIVIRRPTLCRQYHGKPKFDEDVPQVLLAQAKLGRRHADRDPRLTGWRLREKQASQAASFSDFHSLLLYRLSDAAGRNLEPFGWVLAKRHPSEELREWLHKDDFPPEDVIPSTRVIQQLALGIIGKQATDAELSLVDPDSSRRDTIEIHVYWPPGEGPRGAPLAVGRHQEVRPALMQVQRR